jgi:hypothetical protein
MTNNLKQRFKEEHKPLIVCPTCKAIKTGSKEKPEWISKLYDPYNTYLEYKKIYEDHTTEQLCRRCDPKYTGQDWEGQNRRK